MSIPYPLLCRPEDPYQPVTYFSSYQPKIKTTYIVRTLDLPADMLWMIRWTGTEEDKDVAAHQRLYDELISDLEREARDPYYQHLVVIENDIPRLLITVGLETNPYRQVSRQQNNYVWYPRADFAVPIARLLLPIRVALDCCFQFKGVERVFLVLDRYQQRYHHLAIMAGFEPLKMAAGQMAAGSGCYQYRRNFNAP